MKHDEKIANFKFDKQNKVKCYEKWIYVNDINKLVNKIPWNNEFGIPEV